MQRQETFRGILPGYRPIAKIQQEVDTSDIVVARNSLINTYRPHQFTVPDHRKFRFRHQKLCLKTVSINDLYYSSGGSVGVDDLQDMFSFMLPLHGVQQLETGDERHLLLPGNAFVVGPSYPVKQIFSAEYRMLSVRVGQDRLEKFLQEEVEPYSRKSFEFERRITVPSRAMANLLNFIKYICEATIELDEDPYDEMIAEYTERSLLAMLIKTFPNNYSRKFRTNGIEPCQAVIKAEQFIRNNASSTIRVDEIAASANVSVRTLYYAFKKFRGWTPMEFLKLQRLNLSREHLIKSDHTSTTVTDIAYSCGFNHLGKFSRDYALQFGELPRETLRMSNLRNC